MEDEKPVLPFTPPPQLIKNLEGAGTNLEAIKKMIAGFKAMGWDVKEIESMYNTIVESRTAMLSAFRGKG